MSDRLQRVRRVVVLNDFLNVQGGASRVAVDEAVCIARSGIDVIFVGASGTPCQDLSVPGIRVVALGQREILGAAMSPGVVLQNFWNAKAYRAMGEILAGLDPSETVVHLHGYTKALTLAPVRKAREMGFEVVCTLHDFFAACPNGAFFDYVRNEPCERKALSLSCIGARCDKRSHAHKLYRVARGLVQRHVSAFPTNVRHFIGLSRKSVSVLEPYLPRGAKVVFLGNVIPGARRPAVAVADNSAIVAVGRLDREKGVESLVEAAVQAGVGIRFVGDGPLRAMVEAIPGMSVTGWLSADGVRDALEQARSLVFASLWYETFGLVVSEAAARGVPCIVSDVSAAAERVEDGRTGWIVKAGDIGQIAGALRACCDPRTAAAYGKAAFDSYWSEPPDEANHTAGLLTIYDDILSARDDAGLARPSSPATREHAL